MSKPLSALASVVVARFGFGSMAGVPADFAKIPLVPAAILLVVGFVFGRGGRRPLP